jgi:hypothetical protein
MAQGRSATGTGNVSTPARLRAPARRMSRVRGPLLPANHGSDGFHSSLNGVFTAFPADEGAYNPFSTLRVPGLGFDYPHLAAIGGALRTLHSQFSYGHNDEERAFGGSLVPILFGGGYGSDYPDPNNPGPDPAGQPAPQSGSEAQSQAILVQRAAPAQPQPEYQNPVNTAAVGSDVFPAPTDDSSGFLFIRRDGRVLFASMYYVSGPIVHYMTPEGFRRRVRTSDLDVPATRDMNEARGTSVNDIHD